MTVLKRAAVAACMGCVLLCGPWSAFAAETAVGGDEKIVQAQIILTVSESKRLIAKAVAQMSIVKKALKDGMVVVAKGTTNTYVAEEIAGEKIAHGAYVLGKTMPAKGGKSFKPARDIGEVIMVRGKHKKRLSLGDAVGSLEAGDVVIKGANALDYDSKTAAVIVGSNSGGTTGKIMPRVMFGKVHLVIPVGLEKQVSGSVIDITNKMREPVESLNDIPSMVLLTGHIVTEIEAIKTFADVSVTQVAGGGVGGAEGAVRLLCRGTRSEVEKALKLAEEIQGEPPFVE